MIGHDECSCLTALTKKTSVYHLAHSSKQDLRPRELKKERNRMKHTLKDFYEASGGFLFFASIEEPEEQNSVER